MEKGEEVRELVARVKRMMVRRSWVVWRVSLREGRRDLSEGGEAEDCCGRRARV